MCIRDRLETALEWIAESKEQTIDGYMAAHRQDTGIAELKTYFTSVIDWIDGVFTAPPDDAMRGLDWGRLYESYHSTSYKADATDADLQELLVDPAVNDRKAIYEYLLGGKEDPRLLNVRLFHAPTNKGATQRTTARRAGGAGGWTGAIRWTRRW